MNKPLTYLAIPYSHKSPLVRQSRFEIANRIAGDLMRNGHIVFSPISHTHPIAQQCNLPKDWSYWERFDSAYLSLSKKLVVVCIDGWKESIGVQAEIKIAESFGIDIEYIFLNNKIKEA